MPNHDGAQSALEGQPVPGRDRFAVLDLRVEATSLPAAVRRTLALINSREQGYLVFCTASSAVEARKDPRVRAAMEGATLAFPDGMPLVWLGRRAGFRSMERVYGPEFMVELMGNAGREVRHFFYGGDPGVAEKMAERLSRRFPQLQVAGVHTPDHVIAGEVREEDVRLINSARPDVVWVGLGHPKQELWMQAHRPLLNAPVLAGVGAAFDYLSGAKREAPNWMRAGGLQWLHRLAREPRRLWRRYLIGNTTFVWLLWRASVGRSGG